MHIELYKNISSNMKMCSGITLLTTIIDEVNVHYNNDSNNNKDV